MKYLISNVKLRQKCITFVLNINNSDTMARPITETPVLKGKEARVFLKRISVSEKKRIDDATRQRMISNFELLKKASRF